MLNNVVVVGRVVRDLDVKVIDEQKRVAEMTLAVQRDFKNFEGVYDVDFIKVTLWDALAESVSTFSKKGSILAIKGRLQVRKVHYNDVKFNTLELIAMRVNFIPTSKLNGSDEENLDL